MDDFLTEDDESALRTALVDGSSHLSGGAGLADRALRAAGRRQRILTGGSAALVVAVAGTVWGVTGTSTAPLPPAHPPVALGPCSEQLPTFTPPLIATSSGPGPLIPLKPHAPVAALFCRYETKVHIVRTPTGDQGGANLTSTETTTLQESVLLDHDQLTTLLASQAKLKTDEGTGDHSCPPHFEDQTYNDIWVTFQYADGTEALIGDTDDSCQSGVTNGSRFIMNAHLDLETFKVVAAPPSPKPKPKP